MREREINVRNKKLFGNPTVSVGPFSRTDAFRRIRVRGVLKILVPRTHPSSESHGCNQSIPDQPAIPIPLERS
jgi:hypothetical protein